jgi:hypothetical protein
MPPSSVWKGFSHLIEHKIYIFKVVLIEFFGDLKENLCTGCARETARNLPDDVISSAEDSSPILAGILQSIKRSGSLGSSFKRLVTKIC